MRPRSTSSPTRSPERSRTTSTCSPDAARARETRERGAHQRGPLDRALERSADRAGASAANTKPSRPGEPTRPLLGWLAVLIMPPCWCPPAGGPWVSSGGSLRSSNERHRSWAESARLREVFMFKGSFVALVTPFRDGQVDLERLEELVEFHVQSGT